MLNRAFAILGILLALFGVLVVPGALTRAARRRVFGIHRFHPGDGDIPWDLTNWVPVGFLNRAGPFVHSEWTWLPGLRRVK